MLTLTVLLIGGLIYLISCCVSRRPEIPIYGFIAVWLFCPKFIQVVPGLGPLPWDNISIFEAVEAIAAVVLAVSSAVHPQTREGHIIQAGRAVAKLTWLFGAMAVLTFTYVYFVAGALMFALPGFQWRYFYYPTCQMGYAIIFAWSCIRYLDSYRKVAPIFILLAASGIELTLEVVLLYYGNLVTALGPWYKNETGRFCSLAFLSFDTVGIMSIIAICSYCNIVLDRRKYQWLLLLPFLFLPIIGTLAKAPLSGAILGLSVLASLAIYRYRRLSLLVTTMFVAGAFISEASRFADLPTALNEAFGSVGRTDVDLRSTIYARYGLWFRSVDIFIQHFPLGAGNGMVEYAMSAATDSHVSSILHGDVRDAYMAVLTKEHVTNVHNVFLEIAVENGVLGVVFLLFCLLLVGKNFFRFLRSSAPQSAQARSIYYAQACVYAVFTGLGWRYLYEAGDRFYFLGFLFIYLTSVLPIWQAGADRLGRVEALAGPAVRGVPVSLSRRVAKRQ